MTCRVQIVLSAERELERLPPEARARISTRIISLEENPRPRGTKKLSGRHEYRVRVGDYRVLYTVDDGNHVVTISAVGHRRDIYR